MNILINAHGCCLPTKIGDLGDNVLHWFAPLGSCEISDPQFLNIDLKSYHHTELGGGGPRNFPHDHLLAFTPIGEYSDLLAETASFGVYYCDHDYTKIQMPPLMKLSEIIKKIKTDAYNKWNYNGVINFYISSCRKICGASGIKRQKTKNKRQKTKNKRQKTKNKRQKTKDKKDPS